MGSRMSENKWIDVRQGLPGWVYRPVRELVTYWAPAAQTCCFESISNRFDFPSYLRRAAVISLASAAVSGGGHWGCTAQLFLG